MEKAIIKAVKNARSEHQDFAGQEEAFGAGRRLTFDSDSRSGQMTYTYMKLHCKFSPQRPQSYAEII